MTLYCSLWWNKHVENLNWDCLCLIIKAAVQEIEPSELQINFLKAKTQWNQGKTRTIPRNSNPSPPQIVNSVLVFYNSLKSEKFLRQCTQSSTNVSYTRYNRTKTLIKLHLLPWHLTTNLGWFRLLLQYISEQKSSTDILDVYALYFNSLKNMHRRPTKQQENNLSWRHSKISTRFQEPYW